MISKKMNAQINLLFSLISISRSTSKRCLVLAGQNGGQNLSSVTLIFFSYILFQQEKTITSVKLHVTYKNVLKNTMEEIASRTFSNTALRNTDSKVVKIYHSASNNFFTKKAFYFVFEDRSFVS